MPVRISSAISHHTLRFLKQLAANNNRDWFLKHKHLYNEANANMLAFVGELMSLLNRHDKISTDSARRAMYRIYSDVRFHKNRPPYTARFAAHFGREKPMLRGGYNLVIKPGSSFVSCGFYAPNAEDLKRIRRDISYNHEDWKKILHARKFRSHFGAMLGEQVKTAPQGFSKDDPAIELLRYKQFYFRHHFPDKEVLSKDFVKKVNESFKTIRPWFDYMSDILTTNADGESLY
jgi:uncharacterized protein (TIGR02453 family)